jgi:hypothetical protein
MCFEGDDQFENVAGDTDLGVVSLSGEELAWSLRVHEEWGHVVGTVDALVGDLVAGLARAQEGVVGPVVERCRMAQGQYGAVAVGSLEGRKVVAGIVALLNISTAFNRDEKSFNLVVDLGYSIFEDLAGGRLLLEVGILRHSHANHVAADRIDMVEPESLMHLKDSHSRGRI